MPDKNYYADTVPTLVFFIDISDQDFFVHKERDADIDPKRESGKRGLGWRAPAREGGGQFKLTGGGILH